MARLLGVLVGLGIIGITAYGLFAWLWGVPSVADRPTLTDPKAIAEGKYLAAAGDCVSCHTVEDGGQRFAGGRPFDTPFGRLYSTNITPDATTGIGGMTSAEFYQLIAYGADSVWDPLYPAMPYTSFHNIDRDQSDRLHAYFMSLEPVAQPATPNALTFPFSIRPLMFGWNLLFASRAPFEARPDKDDAWNRGAFLVQGPGHCGECHTPRNLLGAMEGGEAALSGAVIGGMEAPDLRPQALAARGWTRADLATYFETGASPQGSAFGEMFLAVKNSLRLLSHDDRVAIASYLMDTTADAPTKGQKAVAAMGDAAHPNKEGQSLYLTHCGLCHGPQGQGMANTMPALKGNATLAQPDGRNLVQVIADGVKPEAMSQTAGYGPMPGYRDRLDTQQITDLANYLRADFAPGGAALPPLTADQVQQILQP
ncbi:c-type cytochrome [Marinibaculum pumilum]|uniref:C-type cytochrome n=1 Tax=Marinibaculum pumilum TaxID=1766165 RepID=A0ABV7L3P3_9PROT